MTAESNVNIIRKDQRQYFEDLWEVVHEKEKQGWAYQGALRKTTVRWNAPRVFSTDVYSRDPTSAHPAESTHALYTSLWYSKSLG